MHGKKRGRRSKGDTWWWNEEVKEAISKNKNGHNVICRNSPEENKNTYKRMRNKASRFKSRREKAGEALTE